MNQVLYQNTHSTIILLVMPRKSIILIAYFARICTISVLIRTITNLLFKNVKQNILKQYENDIQIITFGAYYFVMEYDQEYLIHNFKLKRCSEFNISKLGKGIAIYEVIKIEQGIPIFLEQHLNRLFHSADISNLSINESYCDIDILIGELIKKNNTKEGKINLVIRFEKRNRSNEKDLLIYFTPHFFPSVEDYKNGVKIGSCHAIRGNPNAKILNTEARIKANNKIIEGNLFEVLLINDEGFVTEGSRSNVFFIRDNRVITPPVKDVLNGITRMNIIKLCKQNNIEIIEEKIQYSQIKDMDTLFLSGTSLHALAVKKFEDVEFNTNNKILNRIMELFKELTEKYILSKT